jgi:leucyl aminopeptidase
MNQPNTINVSATNATKDFHSSIETLALCIFEDDPRVSCKAELQSELLRAAEEVVQSGEFKGEAETHLLIRLPEAQNNQIRRLLFVGAGQRAEFDVHALRRIASETVRAARETNRIKHLHFALPETNAEESKTVRAIAEGAYLGVYENDFYQKREEDRIELESFTIIGASGDRSMQDEIERARIIGESINWARSLADEPGGNLPPREFARRAREMAEEFNLRVESLDADEIQRLNMGALWGVGKGSNEPPALIVLRYEPEASSASDELWAFVGKGITFDTGGISIKPSESMEEMKADMAGGAAVLGAMRAIAQLKPARPIVALVPTAENMPSGRALKPGDIVRTHAGLTIEAVDTDAEGRLVLSDALAYATHTLGARCVVDLATLTGSIIVALGDHRTGLFSNDDEWARRVTEASERAGEKVWRMPVSDDYKKRIKSDIADFKNYGGRPDATAAALLLSKFVKDAAWVHLDIAGTAWYDDPQSFAPKGASGVGVRTLVELVCKDG